VDNGKGRALRPLPQRGQAAAGGLIRRGRPDMIGWRDDHVTDQNTRSSNDPSMQALAALNERAREIFRQIVESYLTTGEPVGSRNLARILPMALSPASIRNVMADLEHSGLIFAPHTSAGRLPTELGLRFFVDAMLELGDVSQDEQARIEAQMRAAASGHTFESALAEASTMLSGVSRGAGVVLTTKANVNLKHIEFVRLDAARGLVVLVSDDGSVENRLVDLPPGLPAGALQEATNFLNARLRGRTLGSLRAEIEAGRRAMKRELDAITERLVDAGLATPVGPTEARQLIVRGQANLLDDLRAVEDLERIRLLFNDLETQKDVIDLLARAEGGEGVRIFIGSENKLFSLSGSSLIAAPFRDGSQKIVGVVGVIGPTRLNYARIVPMVDYTARVVSKLLDGGR
jgi:heat-inducible transcriptional repressor